MQINRIEMGNLIATVLALPDSAHWGAAMIAGALLVLADHIPETVDNEIALRQVTTAIDNLADEVGAVVCAIQGP